MNEPAFHSGITDELPEDHPLARVNVYCVKHNAAIPHIVHHGGVNENMDHWFESNSGAYCLDCFVKAYDELDYDQKLLEATLGLN